MIKICITYIYVFLVLKNSKWSKPIVTIVNVMLKWNCFPVRDLGEPFCKFTVLFIVNGLKKKNAARKLFEIFFYMLLAGSDLVYLQGRFFRKCIFLAHSVLLRVGISLGWASPGLDMDSLDSFHILKADGAQLMKISNFKLLK